MSSANEPGVIWKPTANKWERLGHKARYIIIHGTSGILDAVGCADFLENTRHLSVHYIIGTDGRICQMCDEREAAWGNGILDPNGEHDSFWDQGANAGVNPNLTTISIEHGKPVGNMNALTPAQQAASFRLVLHIMQRWGIPLQMANVNGGLTGHFSLQHVNRAECPGPYDWNGLFAYIKAHIGGGSMPVPQGWNDSNGVLTAPNHVPVVRGFRSAIITSASWDSGNVPLEPEVGVKQVLLHNPSVGSGTRQLFRDSLLWYTSLHGVVNEQQLGSELDAAYTAIAALQVQLATLPAPSPVVVPPPPVDAGALDHLKALLDEAKSVAQNASDQITTLAGAK